MIPCYLGLQNFISLEVDSNDYESVFIVNTFILMKSSLKLSFNGYRTFVNDVLQHELLCITIKSF